MDEDEVARWAIRLDNGPLDADEEHALEVWLLADERRQGALLRAEAALAYLDRARALAHTPVHPSNDGWDLSTRRTFLTRAGLFGGLAAAGLIGTVVYRSSPIRISTAIGEIRRVPLPDGSVVSVNTASDLAFAMSDNRRRVRLKDGEAWFQVAHDKTRPFVVEAGAVRVQAVGTAFSVRRLDSGAKVVVTEGIVDIWVAGEESRRTRLAAGSMGFVSEGGAPVQVVALAGDMERTLSWRAGELALDGETLDYAVAEINRYNAHKLVIDSPGLGREPLVGYFRVDRPDDFGRAIARTMGATLSEQGGEIHLSR